MRACLIALITLLTLTLAGPASADPVSDRIYPAPRTPLSIEGLAAGAALIEVETADGLRLRGLEAAARPGMPTLLVFHGNGSSAARSVQWFAPAIARGYGVVAAEYRGYSGNPGQPSEHGLAGDADAFLARARRTAGDGPVWIVGHSLGGGVALALARRSPAEVVITLGTFTRLRDMVSGLTRAVVPDAYRNIDAVPALNGPYFLIHGAADPVVPATQGEALHSLAGAAHLAGASFVILGADHAPAGDLVLPILETIRGRAAAGALSIAGLPEAIKVIPFGQSRPLTRPPE